MKVFFKITFLACARYLLRADRLLLEMQIQNMWESTKQVLENCSLNASQPTPLLLSWRSG